VQEKILQCWKIISRPGSADAVLENDFQHLKKTLKIQNIRGE
jgi:hypothetical protein